eukprot:m.129580 g.129580  ORF g.129580 m.129580 type:complete len:641 (-) comp16409_c0_seq1:242-2164(-)
MAAFGAKAGGFGGFGQTTGFGQPAAAAGGFGQPAAGGFGQPAAGGFGQPAAAGGFGQPAAAAGGFGQPAAGGFGQPAAGGFGQPATSAAGGFGKPALGLQLGGGGAFGAAPGASAVGGYSLAPTLAGSGGASLSAGFGGGAGGFGTAGLGGGGGLAAAPLGSLGAAAGAAKPLGAFGGGQTFGMAQGGFGMGLGGGGSLQQQQLLLQQQQQQQLLLQQQQMQMGPPQYQVFKYGDERDGIIMNFNQLQAQWGKGTFFYSMAADPSAWTNSAPISEKDPDHCFKAIAYNLLPTNDDSEGRVGLVLNVNKEELQRMEQQVAQHIQTIFQNHWPGHSVRVGGLAVLQEGKTELVFELVDDRTQRPVSATVLADFLKRQYLNAAPTDQFAASVRSALERVGCVPSIDAQRGIISTPAFYPIVALSKETLRDYLQTPPEGINDALWEEGKRNNRDPSKLFPTALFGFSGLKRRVEMQEAEQLKQAVRLHGAGEKSIEQQIVQRSAKHMELRARIDELTNNHTRLAKRVMQMMHHAGLKDHLRSAQELELRGKLESLQRELNDPGQFRGKLNELRARVAMQDSSDQPRPLHAQVSALPKPADNVVKALSEHLMTQQEGLQHMIELVERDVKSLAVMEQAYRAAQWG